MKNAEIFNDRKFINKNTYLYYANTNEEYLTLPVKGVVLEFPGLGGSSCIGGTIEMGSYSDERAKDFGKKGILVVYPFPGPWSWGNRGSVRMADAILDAISEKYGLNKEFPLVACGGSMGGLGALIFTADSRYKVNTAIAACPCIDVLDRLACHESFPRTYISAVASYDEDMEIALKRISPMHRIDDMPDTKYFICSDGDDEIFPENQCELYAKKLIEAGHAVEYYNQPGKKHGEFLPEVWEKMNNTIEETICKN